MKTGLYPNNDDDDDMGRRMVEKLSSILSVGTTGTSDGVGLRVGNFGESIQFDIFFGESNCNFFYNIFQKTVYKKYSLNKKLTFFQNIIISPPLKLSNPSPKNFEKSKKIAEEEKLFSITN